MTEPKDRSNEYTCDQCNLKQDTEVIFTAIYCPNMKVSNIFVTNVTIRDQQKVIY